MKATQRVRRRRLKVAKVLHDFIDDEVLPDIGISAAGFWASFDEILHRLAPENRALLAHRVQLQNQIDGWHRAHEGPFDLAAYRTFLTQIGYLEEEGADFSIATDPLDPEMSSIAGPQLVVPVTNARYVLNAANARWVSLYDALYSTDVLGAPTAPGGYDPKRGAMVIAFARNFLDQTAPLASGSYRDILAFGVENGRLHAVLNDGRRTALATPEKFAGYKGAKEAPTAILLENHGLHIEICIDRDHAIGREDSCGISDVIIEAATTTIVDFEDSVSTVDAQDKTDAYRNWLGLMKGTLTARFEKGGKTITRRLNDDRRYSAPDGEAFSLPGRSLLLVRNMGLLPTTDAILLDGDVPAPEGIVDAMITTAIALHDWRYLPGGARTPNSATDSIYIVKPKMHGPEEVAFTDRMFDRVEDALRLRPHTIKMGIMDEERRTSLNLKECIRAARHRIAFINTGFLDRTGDEIHTSMEAGPMVRKGQMKDSRWIKAYEDRNVQIGLGCGLGGHAQIGKGMWAMPDRMADMLAAKIAHPLAGANTAWVPSPTAAALHALHYHEVDVIARQKILRDSAPTPRDALLALPLTTRAALSERDIQDELENNVQGILGYVVHWIDQGVGCSKIPDINNVGLMEDRATLRISSQHIANWLRHGICSREQVLETLRKMAKTVDLQNASDENYRPMATDFDTGIAFQAACALIFEGRSQPNGYTEPLLYRFRRMAKRGMADQSEAPANAVMPQDVHRAAVR